jgi:hypothetical protein
MSCNVISSRPWPYYLAINVFVSLLLSSCGQRGGQQLRPDVREQKSDQALAACEQTRLIADLGLNGDYLYRLARCASNQSENGQETLNATLALTEKLGPEGLDRFTSFLLRPHPGEATREETYPFLTAFTYIMNRGTAAKQGDLNLYEQRFGALQQFMTELDPSRVMELVLDWQRSGEFTTILKQLSLFLQAQQNGNLSAITQELLTGSQLRPHFLATSLELLKQDRWLFQLEQLLQPQTGGSLAKANPEHPCFANWLNRRDEGQVASDCLPQNGVAQQATGGQRVDDFLQQLSTEEKRTLSQMFMEDLDRYHTMAEEERRLFTERLLASLESFLTYNPQNGAYVSGLLQLLLTTQAQDLTSLRDAAETLLEPSYQPTLDKLRAKVGESLILDHMVEQLVRGGPVPGCSNLSLPGLDSAGENLEQLAGAFNRYLMPAAQCDRLPPLTAMLWSELGYFFHPTCQDVDSALTCVPLAEEPSELLSAKFDIASEPAVIRQLINDSLNHVAGRLNQNRYYLAGKSLANGPVDPQLMADLQAIIADQPTTPSDLAHLDRNLKTVLPATKVLTADFLEKLLTMEIERLAAVGQQFQDLIPARPAEDFTAEWQAARVFAGAYTDGPFENLLAARLPTITELTPLPDDIAAELNRNPELMGRFYTRITDADAIFKNPVLGKENEEKIRVTIPGSTALDRLSITLDGNFSLHNRSIIRPYHTLAPKQRSDGPQWGRWDRPLMQSPLVAKDLPPVIGQGFQTWGTELYLGLYTSKPEFWQPLLEQTEPSPSMIRADYFQADAYSPGETRALVAYLLQHYWKTDRLLPETATIGGADQLNEQTPARSFMNAHYLASPFESAKPWTVFYNLLPASFEQSAGSYQELRESMLPEFSQLAADEPFFQIRRYGSQRRLKDYAPDKFSERFKWFSTLNLMTFIDQDSVALPQPVVGFEQQVCGTGANDSQPLACPLEVTGSSPAATYKHYRTYVQRNLDEIFCPLLQSELTTADLPWAALLGFAEDSSFATVCAEPRPGRRYQWPETLRFPEPVLSRIFTDLFTLGKNPMLKAELSSLPLQIRWAKLQQGSRQQALTPASKVRLLLENSAWIVTQQGGAIGRRRQMSASTLWHGFPGLLASYVNAASSYLDPDLYQALLIQRSQQPTADSAEAADPVARLLTEFIAATDAAIEADGSALTVGVNLLARLADDPVARRGLVHSVAHFSSLANYDFLGFELPLALKALFDDFDWQKKPYLLLKQLFRDQHLFGFQQASHLIHSTELDTLVTLLGDHAQRLGDRGRQTELITALLQFVWQQSAAYHLNDDGSPVWFGQQVDRLITATRQLNLPTDFYQSFHRLVDGLDLPLNSLAGDTTGSLRNLIADSLMYAMDELPTLIDSHRRAATVASEQPFFWSNLALDLLTPMAQNPGGATVMNDFIKDPRLGITDGSPSLLESLLQSPQGRADVDTLVATIGQAPHPSWMAAAEENVALLQHFESLLNYAEQRIVWRSPGSDAFADGLKLLHRMSHDTDDFSRKQIHILNLWFDDRKTRPRQWTAQDSLNPGEPTAAH